MHLITTALLCLNWRLPIDITHKFETMIINVEAKIITLNFMYTNHNESRHINICWRFFHYDMYCFSGKLDPQICIRFQHQNMILRYVTGWKIYFPYIIHIQQYVCFRVICGFNLHLHYTKIQIHYHCFRQN